MSASIKSFNKKLFALPLLVAICNGIGSGGGVAWSINGVLFSLVGCAVGAALSFLLGVLSVVLFIVVGLFISFFNFRDMKAEEKKFQDKFQRSIQSLFDATDAYTSNDPNPFPGNPHLSRFLTTPTCRGLSAASIDPADKPRGIGAGQKAVLNREQLFENLIKDMPLTPIPFHKLLIPALFGFIGTTGSLIGCTAGLAGLLTGVGLFTTFAAVPILGWGLIGFSLLAGILIGIGLAYGKQLTLQRKEVRKNIMAMSQELQSYNQQRSNNNLALMPSYGREIKSHPTNFMHPNNNPRNDNNQRPQRVRRHSCSF